MKTLRRMLLVAALALATESVSAKIWIVDSNPGNTARDTTTLQACHNIAATGDTIYLMGSASGYGACTFTKKLYVYGSGYFLSENSNTQANKQSAKTTDLTFNTTPTTSSGSVITGVEIQGTVYLNTNNITIKRCHIVDNNSSYGIVTIGYSAASNNNIIIQNYIENTYTSAFGYGVLFSTSAGTGNVIANNYIEHDANRAITMSAGAGEFSNNVTRGNITLLSGSNFFNNIAYTGSTFRDSGATYNNNIGNSTQFGTANGNQQNVTMSTVFQLTGSTDNNWQIIASGPADNNGVAGADCGMYGGSNPYVLSGMPAIPSIYEVTGPSTGSAGTGLQINIKAKSRN